MTFPTNDDFSNRELSIEELETIAAGGWFSSIVHGIEHVASVIYHDAAAALQTAEKGVFWVVNGGHSAPRLR